MGSLKTYFKWMLLAALVSQISASIAAPRIKRAANNAVANSNIQSEGPGSSFASSISSSNSNGASKAMAGVGSSAPLAVGSMDTSVSRSGHGGGTLSSNTGPFVLPSGGGSASTGVEFGNNGENTNGLQGLLGSGLSSETLLCRLKHNVCGQCQKINELQRMIGSNGNQIADSTCRAFCDAC